MIGMELVKDENKTPAAKKALLIRNMARKKGVRNGRDKLRGLTE